MNRLEAVFLRMNGNRKLLTAAVILKEIEEYCKLEPCSDHHCPCGGAGHYVVLP